MLYTVEEVFVRLFYEGSSKSFITIFDAQVTTFISALILFEFGKGSVKGFATMLMVSTITTLLLIVFIAKIPFKTAGRKWMARR